METKLITIEEVSKIVQDKITVLETENMIYTLVQGYVMAKEGLKINKRIETYLCEMSLLKDWNVKYEIQYKTRHVLILWQNWHNAPDNLYSWENGRVTIYLGSHYDDSISYSYSPELERYDVYRLNNDNGYFSKYLSSDLFRLKSITQEDIDQIVLSHNHIVLGIDEYDTLLSKHSIQYSPIKIHLERNVV